MSQSYDDLLAGWDAALAALISQLEIYVMRMPERHEARGWLDAMSVARRLRGDARTQKGYLLEAVKREEAKQ